MDNIFTYISIGVFVLLGIGFLIGFARSWKKSLSRLIIVGVVLALAILIAPVISNLVISKFSDGTVLNIGSFTMDFTEMLRDIIGSAADDLMTANGTTSALVLSFMHVAINLVMFLALFIVIGLLALIIYWIVFAILGHKAKKKGKTKKKGWAGFGLRCIGGTFGAITMLFIMVAFLTPVFGVINVCNKFVEEEKANAVATASAYNGGTNSLIAGKVYYTDDKTIGSVETALETYEDYKIAFDTSAAGTFFNSFGITALGSKSFEYLTTVKHNDLELNLTNELVAVSKVYNEYKTTFVANEFDIKNNTSVDGVQRIYNEASKSKIVEGYLTELIPTMCDRWTKGESFLGIESPISGEYAPMLNVVLEILKSDDINRINKNVEVILNTVKVANNNGLLSYMDNEDSDLLEYLESNDTLIKDLVENFSDSVDFRNGIPKIFNEAIKVVYKNVIDEDGKFEDNTLTDADIAGIIWKGENGEAALMQQIVNKFAKFANSKNTESEETSTFDLIGNLTDLGEAIDCSRKSKILSKPLYTLLSGLINSDKMGLDERVRKTLNDAIIAHWDLSIEENKDYSFATMFGAVEEAAKVADSFASGEISLDNLEGVLEKVVESEAIKNTILNSLEKNPETNSNIITDMGIPEKDAEIITDTLKNILETSDKDSLKNDIAAAQTIVDLASSTKDGNKFEIVVAEGENKQDKADEIANNIVKSNAIMNMLDSANKSDESAIKDVMADISKDTNNEDLNLIKKSIKNLETETDEEAAKKQILLDLFGIK